MMKFVSNFLLVLGGIIGALWGAFITLDGFIISKAQSTAKAEVRPLKVEMDTHYKHINNELIKIDGKLDKALGRK